ncbi:MAG TPA: hypothetical protein PL041_09925 [Melioribacteraceae bacterium]|nr:hypothetical protein [Melioribacteraceae bacterium]
MKKLSILFVFFIPYLHSAQYSNISLFPSSYFTQGTYNKEKKSNGISLYSTLGINYTDYFTIGFDKTDIESKKEFEYNQNLIVFGFTKSLFPLYIKANFAYQTGKYNYKPFNFSYNDNTNVYGLGFSYYTNNLYFGANYNYITLRGNKSVKVNQPSFNIVYLPSVFFDFSYKLHYSSLKSQLPIYEDFLMGENSADERKLISHIFTINYYPLYALYTKFEVMFGKRAHYFNNDLLTFFNQDDTQNLSIYSKIDYELFKNFRTILSYNYLSLDHSKIIYYSIGIKYNIWDL